MTPAEPAANWEAIVKSNQQLQKQLGVYLNAVTPDGVAPALSVETSLLAQELRSDRQYGAGGRPLRLLSLGWSNAIMFLFFSQGFLRWGRRPSNIFSLYPESHYGQDHR